MVTTVEDIEILLVEDNVEDAGLTIRALKKNNISNKLIHLTDGQQAIDFLFATGEYSQRNIADKPKVILLDLKMPKINGLQVIKAIKDDERTKLIPVVVLTSSKEDKDILECYKLGVNSYIVKPVEFEDFLKAVSELGLYWLLVNHTPR